MGFSVMSPWVVRRSRAPWTGLPGRERLLVAVLALLCLAYLGVGVDRYLSANGLENRFGTPVGTDFVMYYAAAALADGGWAAAAYDQSALAAREAAIVGPIVPDGLWTYPPTLFLFLEPLASLSYLSALFVWLAVGIGLYAAALHAARPEMWAVLAGLLYPGAADVLLNAQNGYLTAALLGGGLALMGRRPLLAGVLFGLLTFKPHLGLALVVALIAGREWRTIAAAAATALGLAGASVLAYGAEPWLAFFASLGALGGHLDDLARYDQVPTVLMAALKLGLGQTAARVLQIAAALAALTVVWRLWRGDAPLPVRAAGLVLAIPLTTPYAQFYDLAILAFALVWLGAEAVRAGWRPGEKHLLLALVLAPMVTKPISAYADLQLWPFFFVWALVLIKGRADAAPT